MNNEPGPGQVWEYEDRRTGWKYLVLLVNHRITERFAWSENFDAYVLDWDRDYEYSHRMEVISCWELRTHYTRLT